MKSLRARLRQFHADDSGATLVEFAIVICIFVFLLFGVIDFARLSYSVVMAGNATELGVRLASTRAPLCKTALTQIVARQSLTSKLSYPDGSRCAASANLCAVPPTLSCSGSAISTNGGQQIWARLAPLMPSGATLANLKITYSYDAAANRVGTRYAPLVTVEITNLDFDFISPLGALAKVAGAANASGLDGPQKFPALSASLPSEDLE
jgi:Flp pilus assembly protein TadG